MIDDFGKNTIAITMNRIFVYIGTTVVSILLLFLSFFVLSAGWTILLYPLAIISVLWGSFWFINNELRINKIDIKSTPHATVKKRLFSKRFFIEGVTAFPRYPYLYLKDQITSEYRGLYLFATLFIFGNILFLFALSDNHLEVYIFLTLMFGAILLTSFMLNKSPAYMLFILKAMQFFGRFFGDENKKELELEGDINWPDVIVMTLILLLLIWLSIDARHFLSLLESAINIILSPIQ